jgi:hypothetical protein
LDWEPHSVRWADFGSVLAEGAIDQNYIYIYMLSSIKLPRTVPLVLESDNRNSSFGQQQIKHSIP